MSSSDPALSITTTERIRQEIARLAGEQTAALEAAVYGGMSRAEMRAYDQRLERLAELHRSLALMEDKSSPQLQAKPLPPRPESA